MNNSGLSQSRLARMRDARPGRRAVRRYRVPAWRTRCSIHVTAAGGKAGGGSGDSVRRGRQCAAGPRNGK